MRVFESLNCIVCKEPFARVANQPRSPRHLRCGLGMCYECLVKDEEMDEKERKHQCSPFFCLDSKSFAYFLIDVLSQESALVFTPMGYLLAKPFKIPECPICHDEYSNEIEAKKSFALGCGHIICTECCLKTPQEFYSLSSYQIKCPTCTKTYRWSTANVKRKDRFHDFLKELPEMTRQMKQMDSPKMKASLNAVMNALTSSEDRSCSECHKKDIVDEMFYCSECGSEICGACAYKKHRLHEAIPLFEKQANQMSKELQQESKLVINGYKDLVPELHKGLFEGINFFETKLLAKEEKLTDASTRADLQEKHESFTKINSTFESYAEDYLYSLRKFDTGVNQLIQTLNEIHDA